jgi:Holliday junction resolvase RusA-like endonuclease
VIALTIPGEPCGKGRPKFCKVGKFARAYTPPGTRVAESNIVAVFQTRYPDFTPLDGPMAMSVIAYMSVPASASAKARVAMLAQRTWPTKKPDADNILKLVADALNGLAYVDDKQIVTAKFHKVYSDRPRLEIYITRKEDANA